MSSSRGSTRRDGTALAVGYGVLCVGAVALGVWGLSSRDARAAQGTTHVWATWFPAALWLAGAALTAWQSRVGRLRPFLLTTVVLLVAWLMASLLVVFDGPDSVGWYVVPQVAIGMVAAILLGSVVRTAGRARRT